MAIARLAFGFLAIAVLSGLALAPLLSAGHPLESLETLRGGIPWGWWLRAVHAWAGWGLLALTAVHLGDVVLRRAERKLGAGIWWRSVVLLPVTVLALLGGFLLRGDAEAAAAAAVWREIAGSIPLAGPFLADLLVGALPGDLGAVALHHAGTFTLLLWLLTAEHGGRLWPDSRATVLAGLSSVTLAGFLPPGLGASPAVPSPHLLLGPWYLLGLQGALVSLPAASGWLLPLLLVVALGLIRHADGRARAALVAFCGAWLAADAAFTVRVLLLAHGR